ncbi:MAG: FAD:protein FMN transferase [Hyphomicrobiaceae bacterium]
MISRRAQPWLGTLVEIVAEGVDVAEFLAASDRAFARVAAVHTAMSFQTPDSELTRVNRDARTGWVALSPDTSAVFAAALEFARASRGLFDPSVAGWLVESGHLPRHPGFPRSAAPDWRAIELDGDRVRYTRPLLVDLSGIAKGYAVDAALASLASSGLTTATVNAGGDLARFGNDTAPICVRLPHHPTHSLQLAKLKCGAAATSASYFQPDALRHPHNSGSLCTTRSVTVLAGDCITADALTKVVAADSAAAVAVLARFGAQAIVIEGARAMRSDTGGWHDLPLEQAA